MIQLLNLLLGKIRDLLGQIPFPSMSIEMIVWSIICLVGVGLIIFLLPITLGNEKVQLFFCIPKPGEAIPLAASGEGRITRFAYEPGRDFHLNDPEDEVNFDHAARPWERLPNTWARTAADGSVVAEWKWKDRRSLFTKLTGYHFFLYPWVQVHSYKFSWSELTQPKAKGEVKFVPESRVEQVRSIFLKNTLYYSEGKNIPDSGNIPLRVKYSFTLRTTNPFVSLAQNDEFLLRVFTRLEETIRFHCGQKSYVELRSEKDSEKEAEAYEKLVTDLNPIMKEQIGQEVVDITILEVDLMDGDDDSAKALRELARQEQLAAARIVESEGKAKAMELEEGKKIELLDRRLAVETSSPERVELSKFDAFARSNVTVVGGGGPVLGLNLEELLERNKNKPTTGASKP